MRTVLVKMKMLLTEVRKTKPRSTDEVLFFAELTDFLEEKIRILEELIAVRDEKM